MNRIIIYIAFYTILLSLSLPQCDYQYGDANNDNSLDIIDVVIIIDAIFDNQVIDVSLIDLNFDSYINIFDIIILIERILDNYPQHIEITDVNFDFDILSVSWDTSDDYGFIAYNLYYSNFINNEEIIIFSSDNINDNFVQLNNIILNEQNYFWIGVIDFTGCELIGSQYIYELPYKEYELNSNGDIINTEFSINDFRSSDQCASCHENHYNEWFSSMHSYTMRSPLFFSYKEMTNESHPSTGERFCMQCHNPISYLTGEDLSEYGDPDSFQSSDVNQVLKEGIGCDVCHTMSGISETIHTSDNIAANATYKMYPLGNIKFGPIVDPEPNEYHESYYLPTYNTSQMCLPCHDLVVRDVEAEITFTEWDRIPGFSMFGGVSCQECHMPLKDNGYHDHSFIGVDMDLSIPLATNPLYEQVASLLANSANISFNIFENILPSSILTGDTLSIPVSIESQTAHSIPSGTSFNRESWIELIVKNNDNIIYSSGLINNNQSLNLQIDPQLLIFSSYMYDENGDPTNNITDMYSMDNYSLSAYQKRYHYYDIYIPHSIEGNVLEGNIEISARLLFRSLKPDFVLSHHPEFIDNLPVFEIFSINQSITIVQ